MKDRSGQKKKVLQQFSDFIQYNAGNDPVGLITGYLATKAGKSKCSNWVYEVPVFKKLLAILHNCFINAKDYNKRQWLSVVRHAGLTAQELRDVGWDFSNKAWHTAGKHSFTSYAGAPVREDRGRMSLSPVIVNSIKHCVLSDEMSRPAANRTVKSTDSEEQVPVRYRNFSQKDSFHMWRSKQQSSGAPTCSKSSFIKVLKTIRHLKKARIETDKCEICVEGKRCEQRLAEIQRDPSLAKDGEQRKLKKCVDMFNKHRSDSKHQRESFEKQKQNLKEGQAILLIDFKANLVLNQDASVQVSKEFYQNCQLSLFGAVLFFFEEDMVKLTYFDILSDCTTHNSYFVTHALNSIFDHEIFKSKNFTSISFWLDNGPHFKTKELFYYFYEISSKYRALKDVQWNFFVEYHGKNLCDVRFSQVKSMIDIYVKNPNNPRLLNIEQIANVLKESQEKYNNERQQHNNTHPPHKHKPLTHACQILLDIPEMPPKVTLLDIANFRFEYYSFKRSYDTVKASFLTGQQVMKSWQGRHHDIYRTGILCF